MSAQVSIKLPGNGPVTSGSARCDYSISGWHNHLVGRSGRVDQARQREVESASANLDDQVELADEFFVG